jgi:polygalacturonase
VTFRILSAFLLLLGITVLAHAIEAPVGAPPAPVFDPYQFGAKGDSISNDQLALQRAIDACKGSGGSVFLHDGRFLTGQITLGSNMTLYIAPSAALVGIGSISETDYPTKSSPTPNRINETCQRRLIYGENLDGVAITGGGTLDGQGDFAPWVSHGEKIPERLRPSVIEIANSRAVEVSHLKLLRSGMWTQVYLECNALVLRGLTVDTGDIPSNRDGMDICDCHDVLVEDCEIRSQDDGICFKSGSAVGCRDIVVRRCSVDKMGLSAGNCLKFGTISCGAFENVTCEDLVLRNTRNTAITWESVDGAMIRNVEVRDCNISATAQAISVMLGRRSEGPIGSVADLTFENITTISGVGPIACLVTGMAGHPTRNLRFSHLKFVTVGGIEEIAARVPEYAGGYPEGTHFGNLPGSALYLRHVDRVRFSDCEFATERTDARPWLATEDVVGCEQINVSYRAH